MRKLWKDIEHRTKIDTEQLDGNVIMYCSFCSLRWSTIYTIVYKGYIVKENIDYYELIDEYYLIVEVDRIMRIEEDKEV